MANRKIITASIDEDVLKFVITSVLETTKESRSRLFERLSIEEYNKLKRKGLIKHN